MTVGTACNVQAVGVGKLRRIPVGGPDAERNQRPRLQRDAPDLGRFQQTAVAELVGAFEAQELLDGRDDQVRLGTQARHLIRVLQQGGDAVADQVGGGLVTGVQQEDAVLHQLHLAQPFAGIGRLGQQHAHHLAALGQPALAIAVDVKGQIVAELGHRAIAPVESRRARHRFESPQNRQRPVAQRPALAFGNTEHVADDLHRQAGGVVGHHVHPAPRLGLVQHLLDHLDEARLQQLQRPWRESRCEQPPHAGMQRGIVEDETGGVVQEQRRVAVLRRELDRLVGTEAAVAIDGGDVIVAGEENTAVGLTMHRVEVAQQPVGRIGILQEGLVDPAQIEGTRTFARFPLAQLGRQRDHAASSRYVSFFVGAIVGGRTATVNPGPPTGGFQSGAISTPLASSAAICSAS